MSFNGEVVEVVLPLLGRPRPSAGPVGVFQGYGVVDIQEPGKLDSRAGEGSQPLTADDCASPNDPEAHIHRGFLYQEFGPRVLAIAVGVDPTVIPGFPAVGGKVFRDG